MTPKPPALAVDIWFDPVAMDTEAPEPVLVREGEQAWVVYRAHDAEAPDHDDPRLAAYVKRQGGQQFGVLVFDGVKEASLGPPAADRLRKHPLFDEGLEHYEFHQVRERSDAVNRWIVSFHRETLEVRARAGRALPVVVAPSAAAALVQARQTVA